MCDDQPDPQYPTQASTSLAILVAALISILGVLALVALIVQQLQNYSTALPRRGEVDVRTFDKSQSSAKVSRDFRSKGLDSQSILRYKPQHCRGEIGAGGGTRTRTGVSSQRILSPLRLPFRHPGVPRTSQVDASVSHRRLDAALVRARSASRSRLIAGSLVLIPPVSPSRTNLFPAGRRRAILHGSRMPTQAIGPQAALIVALGPYESAPSLPSDSPGTHYST